MNPRLPTLLPAQAVPVPGQNPRAYSSTLTTLTLPVQTPLPSSWDSQGTQSALRATSILPMAKRGSMAVAEMLRGNCSVGEASYIQCLVGASRVLPAFQVRMPGTGVGDERNSAGLRDQSNFNHITGMDYPLSIDICVTYCKLYRTFAFVFVSHVARTSRSYTIFKNFLHNQTGAKACTVASTAKQMRAERHDTPYIYAR